MTTPIFLLAPAAGMEFIAMPSGATYVANQYGLVTITNGSVADELALIAAGCNVCSAPGDGNISAETSRAEAAEAVLQSDVIAETSRAEGVEAALQASLVAANIGIYASASAAQSSSLANGAYYFIPSTHGGSVDLYLKNSSSSSTFVATLASVNQSSVTAHATVAAMLSAYGSSVTLTDGQIFVCAGRDAIFDSPGVSLVYAYNSGDTTSADNGGPIRVDGQGRRYYAVGPIYFDHFGMHASNTGASNNAGWQAALNWQRNGNGVTQGNPAPGKLWGRANSTYNVTDSGDLTGGLAINNTTQFIYIDGDGPNCVISGTLSAFAPVLDVSGQGYCTLGPNLTVSAWGSASCAVMNLALPVSQTNLSGNENGSAAFLGNYYCYGAAAPVGALITNGCDNSSFGSTSSTISSGAASSANGPLAGNGGLPGIYLGDIAPTQAGLIGIAEGGSSNTVTVPAGSSAFPTTNGALVGFALIKINGSNVREANYITGYVVSGSVATITVDLNWNANPVASTDKIVVNCIKSLYQPLAGTGIGGGFTDGRVSSNSIGGGIPIYMSGGTLLTFVGLPYLACSAPGTQQTSVVCINNFGLQTSNASISGKVNAENYGSGISSLIWSTDSVSVDLELGRLAGAFTELFRCTAVDATMGSGVYAGFNTVRAFGGGQITAQPVFNVGQSALINYVEIIDDSMSALGTVTNGITDAHLYGNLSMSIVAAMVAGGTLNGTPIIQPTGYTGRNSGALPAVIATDLIVPTTAHTTTGGSSQPRVTYALPANTMPTPPYGGQPLLIAKLAFFNASTSNCTCLMQFAQGSNTTNTNTITVPGNAVLEVDIWVNQYDFYYKMVAGANSIAMTETVMGSWTCDNGFSMTLYENGTGGDVMDLGGVHRFTVGGNS